MPERTLVLSKAEIDAKVRELAARIDHDYRGKDLVLIGVLNGAYIFLADLARALTIPHQIDFVRVASYGHGDTSSGTITFTKDVELELKDRHVLLVEDIVDTGRTLTWLSKTFRGKQAATVRTCALVNKKERRAAEVEIDYPGFTLQEGFLVGYGLDYAERYRSLPEIYSLHM